jgi:hypothetical protein
MTHPIVKPLGETPILVKPCPLAAGRAGSLNERNGRIRPPVTGKSLGTVWVRPKRSGWQYWKNEGQMALFESSSGHESATRSISAALIKHCPAVRIITVP